MTGLINRLLRGSVTRMRREHPVQKVVRLPPALSDLDAKRRHALEESVILGVLLNRVAHADGNLSPEEERCLEETLCAEGTPRQEAALVIAAAREAADKRPDIQGFTREINKHPYLGRLRVVELLFKIAYADRHLSPVELESVRQIAGLLWVSHKDFIDAKLRAREKPSGPKRNE